MSTPDILLIGQITVDDTVPASPGPWQRKLGGNALYALAGARLWCEPERLGVVARVPSNLPFDVEAMLENAGMSSAGLVPCAETALIEWILYEEDGNRQSVPRNPVLRDPSVDGNTLYQRYLVHIGNISASADDVPAEWLPAMAIHLAPQVVERHQLSAMKLSSQTELLSLDPSPHYSRSLNGDELHALLAGVTAFLPSQAEVEGLGRDRNWTEVVRDIRRAGFPEVVLKRGSAGCLLATSHESVQLIAPAACNPIDLTGAGDAFSGAYIANRALGHSPFEAAQRACVTAAMIIECYGTMEAFRLEPSVAADRLKAYKLQKKG